MDADLQHDESKILEMMKIQKKYNLDMVVGSRFLEKTLHQPYQKEMLVSQVANWLANKISRVQAQ